MGGDLGEFTYGKRWVLLGHFYDCPNIHNTLRDGQAEPYQARWPDLQWGWRPQTGHRAKECSGYCLRGLEKTFWQVISSIFSVLGLSWPALDGSWGRLGALVAALGAVLARLGPLLGLIWAARGPPEGHSGSSFWPVVCEDLIF